jgi:hypothetical protein
MRPLGLSKPATETSTAKGRLPQAIIITRANGQRTILDRAHNLHPDPGQKLDLLFLIFVGRQAYNFHNFNCCAFVRASF